MLDKEGQQRAFKQFMEIYVLPEINRRKERRVLSENFSLEAAQILFQPGKSIIVRLNEETKICCEAKVKNISDKKVGDVIPLSEIEEIKIIGLPDEEEPEYGHVSMVKIKGHWLFTFDLRYNKGLAREHLETAKQFYKSAYFSYENKLWSPFIDNLFSSIELMAKGELLLFPSEELTTHKGIQIRYNEWIDIGNAKSDFKTTLNKLSGLRNSARYLKSDFQLTDLEAKKYLEVAKEMSDYLENRLKKHLFSKRDEKH